MEETSLNRWTQPMDIFKKELWELQKERIIRRIIRSIQGALESVPKNIMRDFSYNDIFLAARANCYTGDDTFIYVNEALSRVGLKKEDFP